MEFFTPLELERPIGLLVSGNRVRAGKGRLVLTVLL